MRTAALVLLLGLLGTAGCTLSLHPTYTDADLVYEAKLVGTWREQDDPDERGDTAEWRFARDGEKAYRLTVLDGKDSATFSVHVARLGKHTYLDMVPAPPRPPEASGELYEGFYLPLHWPLRMRLEDSKLYLYCLSSDWLGNKQKEGKLPIRYEEVEDYGPLVTSPTREFRQFLSECEDPAAFGEACVLIRQP